MDLTSLTPSQRRAVTYLDGPLLICAGAGSGKTFTLTQRIAWALMPGSGFDGAPYLESIDAALIITFTNKAAGEIKDRVRRTLREEGMTEAALAVDNAWISTIHGMCNRILHEHALELGLDPAFELAMDTTSAEALHTAITRVLDRAKEEHPSCYASLFAAYAPDRIRSFVEEALTQASYVTCGLDAFHTGPAPADAADCVRNLLALADAVQISGTTKNKQTAKQLADDLQNLMLTGKVNIQTVADVLSGVELSGLAGKNPATSELKALIKTTRTTLSVAAQVPLLQALLALSREVDEAYHAELSRRGMLDTSDLIRTTLRAFDEHPALAAQYTERFRLIMVDEFQDTSQLQIDMIERIAGPLRTHLCTVGDSQQSIYRFQGADVEVYLQHKANMMAATPTPAHREELGSNFRSHSDVLAFVRKVCGARGYFQEAFLDLTAETSGKTWHATEPRIELSVTRYGKDLGNATQAARAEAMHIATRFAKLRDAGHAPADMVLLMGTTTGAAVYARALRAKGFNVVVAGGSKFFETAQVKTALALLSALANPYDSEQLLVLLSSEALPVSSDDLLAMSTYYDPQSHLMLRQNLARGFVRKEYEPQKASPALTHAIHVLRRAWGKLGRVRPAQLFRETLFDTGWLARMEADGAEGMARAADVLKFVRLVEDAAQDGLDLPRISAELTAQAQAAVEKPGALSQDSIDAVRIMTVHASKGLQFPIVAIANCTTVPTERNTLATVACGGSLYVSLLPEGFKTDRSNADVAVLQQTSDLGVFVNQIKAINAEREYAERKRLFYVAATRASDAVLVAVKHRVLKTEKYPDVEEDLISALFADAKGFPEVSGTFDYGGSEPARYTAITVDAQEDDCQLAENAHADSLVIPDAFCPGVLTARAMLQPMSARADFFSYSSLAHEYPQEQAEQEMPAPTTVAAVASAGIPGTSAPAISGAAPAAPIGVLTNPQEEISFSPVGDADKATLFGSAFHQACELLALRCKTDCPALTEPDLARIASQWGVHDILRLRSALDCWHNSALCKRAFAYTYVEPETPFCVTVANGYLEGSIDLLCYNDRLDALIVDYKTGTSLPETQEALYTKHLLQAQCYALAALRAGFAAVNAQFAHIEQPAPADAVSPAATANAAASTTSTEPKVVTYAFTAKDTAALEAIVAAARQT